MSNHTSSSRKQNESNTTKRGEMFGNLHLAASTTANRENARCSITEIAVDESSSSAAATSIDESKRMCDEAGAALASRLDEYFVVVAVTIEEERGDCEDR